MSGGPTRMPEPFDDELAPAADVLDDPIAAAEEVDLDDLARQAADEDARRQLADEQTRRFAEDQARHEALHDPLTRLPNRALCLDRLSHALATTVWTRTSVAVLALGVDLDRATLGQERAGELCKAIAGRLVEILGAGDTVARLEGDEFAIVTEGLVEEAEGVALAERLVGAFDPPFLVGGVPTHAQVGVGVIVTKDHHSESATVLAEAEQAMHHALERGPGHYDLI